MFGLGDVDHELFGKVKKKESVKVDWAQISQHLTPRHLVKMKINKNKFDEKFYLSTYPDVEKAIKNGAFNSGYEHWIGHGLFEHRIAKEI